MQQFRLRDAKDSKEWNPTRDEAPGLASYRYLACLDEIPVARFKSQKDAELFIWVRMLQTSLKDNETGATEVIRLLEGLLDD